MKTMCQGKSKEERLKTQKARYWDITSLKSLPPWGTGEATHSKAVTYFR